MANVLTITETFKVDGELNPLMVNASVCVEHENGHFSWAVSHINFIELVVGDELGVDVTKDLLKTNRAKALIESQVSGLDEQIIGAYRELIERRVAI